MSDYIKKLSKEIEGTKQHFVTAFIDTDNAVKQHNENVERFKTQETELTQEAFSEKCNKEQKEFSARIAEIRTKLDEAISDIKASFMDIVATFYMPSGTSINEDDVKLLNSGINLTEDEFKKLIEKNSENVTMIRIIGQNVAEKNVVLPTKYSAAFIRAAKNGEVEEHIFDRFTNNAGYSIVMAESGNAGTSAYRLSQDKLEAYIEEAIIDLKKTKVFFDAETEKAVNEYEKKKIDEHNASYDPRETDWIS